MTTEDKAEAKEAPKATPDLAMTRTILAADRTLMAWIRTAFTFLGFGSTVYVILKSLQDAGRLLPNENTPRNLGLFLSMIGVVSILLGGVDYWLTLRQLRQTQTFSYIRPTLIMALIMSAFGLFLFFGIILRLF